MQGIDDYAISQTSLEQIFNGFAGQQEEETNAVRGMVQQQPPPQQQQPPQQAELVPPTPAPAPGTENVTVPEGLQAGDKFQTTVGGVLVELAVPGMYSMYILLALLLLHSGVSSLAGMRCCALLCASCVCPTNSQLFPVRRGLRPREPAGYPGAASCSSGRSSRARGSAGGRCAAVVLL
jgi:hypothetical protein